MVEGLGFVLQSSDFFAKSLFFLCPVPFQMAQRLLASLQFLHEGLLPLHLFPLQRSFLFAVAMCLIHTLLCCLLLGGQELRGNRLFALYLVAQQGLDHLPGLAGLLCICFFAQCRVLLQATEFILPGLQLLVEFLFLLCVLAVECVRLFALSAHLLRSFLRGLLLDATQLRCNLLLTFYAASL